MTDHLGEQAALYALGALDQRERTSVDEHVGRCSACLRLLAQAEADVATIAAAQRRHAAPRALATRISALVSPPPSVAGGARFGSPLRALAAAIAIAILPLAVLWHENLVMHRAMLADAQVMGRLAASPHRTVAFASHDEDAHVMYAPDGSWYCVVVRGARVPLDLTWVHDGTLTMLGTAVPRGETAVLYLPKSHRMDRLALRDGPRVVAEARLLF